MEDKELQSEVERLLKYIDDSNNQLQKEMVLSGTTDKDAYLIIALMSLYHAAIDQAKAVAYCSQHKLGNASRTCLRALFEIGLDLRLILEWNDCHENAIRFLTVAKLEFKDAVSSGKIGDDLLIERLDTTINEYSSLYPEVVANLRKEISDRRYIKHWSGLSRKKRYEILEHGEPGSLNATYRYLSWDAHSIMAIHRSHMKIQGDQFQWFTTDEVDPKNTLIDIDSAGRIFNGISSKMFSAPIFKEKKIQQ
jgi:hypothetical protein